MAWKQDHKNFAESLAPSLRGLGEDPFVLRAFRLSHESLKSSSGIDAARAAASVSLLFKKADSQKTPDDLAAVYQRAARFNERLLLPHFTRLDGLAKEREEKARQKSAAIKKGFDFLQGGIEYICSEISAGEQR